MVYSCNNCKQEVETDGKPGRTDTCPSCDADLHCCLNCVFYDPNIYNECRESQAERVLDKDRSNFCDYFVFKTSDTEEIEVVPKKKSKKKENPLDSLFKK